MEHMVKTRGGLIWLPADHLLKRIQSVVKNCVVKMPSCMVFSVSQSRSNSRLNYTPKEQHLRTSVRTFKYMLNQSRHLLDAGKPQLSRRKWAYWRTVIWSKCYVDRPYADANEIFTRIQSVTHNFIRRCERVSSSSPLSWCVSGWSWTMQKHVLHQR
jgi:hypothetical protein